MTATAARPLRLLLVGFGNVGRALAEILRDRGRYPGLAGLKVEIVGVTTGSHGALLEPKGIDPARALAAYATGDLGGRGADPRAATLVAVMDGAPVFNLALHCLAGNVVTRLDGVLNSTTNVVLGLVERGASLAEGIAEAQRLGVAETDPSLDLDGWDAAVKLAALANAVMGVELRPEAVARQSLREVDETWVRGAPACGCRVKLVAEAERTDAGVAAAVTARELPMSHPFARTEGAGSVLRIATDLMGTIVLAEEAPDLRTTAYGVIADLLEIAAGHRR
jgi:homoserine dehydrogenase